mgnify:CR=1 FL=1
MSHPRTLVFRSFGILKCLNIVSCYKFENGFTIFQKWSYTFVDIISHKLTSLLKYCAFPMHRTLRQIVASCYLFLVAHHLLWPQHEQQLLLLEKSHFYFFARLYTKKRFPRITHSVESKLCSNKYCLAKNCDALFIF